MSNSSNPMSARELACSKMDEALAAFNYSGEKTEVVKYGSGHINDTFRLTAKDGDTVRRYILQRMNHEIFKRPDQLMANITGVTEFLTEEIKKNGGDPERETLTIVKTKDGKSFFKDSIGSYWRMYLFIEDAICLDAVTCPEEFYESAVAFGNFQRLLSKYPADTLYETIPNFHNTPDRFKNLHKAIDADVMGRAASVKAEIEFALGREKEASILAEMQKKGELPLRVTHNDTKLNNVMLDSKTRKGICVIDLDTVMPGLAIHDFGDSIRFGASTGAEDEPDLSKIEMDLDLFAIYVKGFLEGCGGALTPAEIKMMPMGAKMMTLEVGIRFLTDYLEGDHYFMIHREGHNLDRTRTQLKLVADMEKKWDKMNEIVSQYL